MGLRDAHVVRNRPHSSDVPPPRRKRPDHEARPNSSCVRASRHRPYGCAADP
jgi:hypothetical protein